MYVITSYSIHYTKLYDKGILEEERVFVMRSDVRRSIIFLLLALVTLFVYSKGKIKTSILVVVLSILTFTDVWVVAKRYINESSFQKKSNAEFHSPTAADKEILKDKDPNYRVLNLTTSTFNEASYNFV